MQQFDFEFKGGIKALQGEQTCKFLMFFLNGDREISFSQAIKSGFVENKIPQSVTHWNPQLFMSKLPIVKIMIHETGGFGKPKLSQTFFLALGQKLERQVVTIKPKMTEARRAGFYFKADASFMKKSEILQILDPNSISAKIISMQQQPPVSVLKQIISIDHIGVPKELKIASHGGVRKLRIR